MFRRLLGLFIVGFMLASCGTSAPGGGLKDVKATSADNAVTVSWSFDGDKTAIKGFRIFRNVGGDSSSYTQLTDVTDVNATSYTDRDVEQGESFKYGVAVINSNNTLGTIINQAGAAVGPKPIIAGSLTGNWKTIRTNDDPVNTPYVLTMSLDITDASGVLSGNAYLFSEGDPFGRGNQLGTIEGTNGSSGFTLRIVFTSSGFLELRGSVSGTTISGTSVDANAVTGTFTGEKLTQ